MIWLTIWNEKEAEQGLVGWIGSYWFHWLALMVDVTLTGITIHELINQVFGVATPANSKVMGAPESSQGHKF